jgi:transketolase
VRNAFINTVIEACRTREDIFILSGDAGLGVFDRFRNEHPDRFLNMGVAEQNTISFAAGMALAGLKVFVYNIIPFLLYRSYEQVRNDICGQNLPVVLVGIGSGITYAPMGMSHYSVEDIGLAQTLPNLVTMSPMDPEEARVSALYALNCDKPVYVRLAKCGEPSYHTDETFDIAMPQVIREGRGTAVVFHGSISKEVMAAYDILESGSHRPLIVSIPTLQPLKAESLLSMLSGIDHVVCVEEHFTNCGLGNMLERLKAARAAAWRLSILGIPPHFIHEIRTSGGFRDAYGISASHIVRSVESGGEA